MANPEEKTDGAMKAFITIMVVVAIGLGGMLYWQTRGIEVLSVESTKLSLQATQGRQADRIRQLREIKEFRFPSVENALKVRDNVVSEKVIQATKDTVRIIIGDLLGTDKLSGIADARAATASSREEFERWSMRMDLKEITETDAMRVIREVVAQTGKYATISDLTLKASKFKEADLAEAIDPTDYQWDLILTLTWFQPNPKYAAKIEAADAPGT